MIIFYISNPEIKGQLNKIAEQFEYRFYDHTTINFYGFLFDSKGKMIYGYRKSYSEINKLIIDNIPDLRKALTNANKLGI